MNVFAPTQPVTPEYASPGTVSPAPGWILHLQQIVHRLAIVATLLLTASIFVAVKGKPADSLGGLALVLADAAILMSGVMIFYAHRAARPTRELVGLLVFSLLIAHLAGYLYCTHFQSLAPLRTSLIEWRILDP